LALAYASELDREKALAELKLAEWFNPENDSTELLIAMAYSALGELPAAGEPFDKCVAWSRKRGIQPEQIDALPIVENRRKTLARCLPFLAGNEVNGPIAKKCL
jgi:hypothetical protein